ncbi:uncharacterized protein HMPREF1120_05244 [Exophiala dermatitidis NIH/UT8656]|uniref:Uncharacterized protein n=1 Tax=Exophiala dermatitidis (strain ATCC 34100 / CBS 525.76 / NIH/UT8656) TaxID=858893 RepID=H6C0A2_EXODN|nr:uncharacterized protein HMPREF1120_05244 [Exophiala dermatitidis NIH/UT8656]EHY57197.1 hypothetical protein HMPREF1120_05244 [Exophiala dermatitidis NIH/UT8656]
MQCPGASVRAGRALPDCCNYNSVTPEFEFPETRSTAGFMLPDMAPEHISRPMLQYKHIVLSLNSRRGIATILLNQHSMSSTGTLKTEKLLLCNTRASSGRVYKRVGSQCLWALRSILVRFTGNVSSMISFYVDSKGPSTASSFDGILCRTNRSEFLYHVWCRA